MTSRVSPARLCAWVAIALALGSCHGNINGIPYGNSTYTIGGTVTGLAANQSVTLANGTDSVTVSQSGSFTFSQQVSQNGSYSVTVKTQPTGQSCVVSNGSGTATANVTAIQVACSGLQQYAYVVNNTDATISQFSVGASGTLTPLSPATLPTGNSPRSVTIDPTRHYVYVTNLNDNTVSQYVIQTDGTLAANSTATVATGRGPWALEFDPQDKFAYVVNSQDNTISQYSVGANGVLDPLSVSPVSTGYPGPWNITLTPDGKYAYVSDYGTAQVIGLTVSQYAKAPDTGELSPLNPAAAATGRYPGGSAVDANSAYIYVTAIDDGTVWQYSIGSSGELTPLSPNTVAAGNEPSDVVITPNNKYVYVANYLPPVGTSGTAGTVSQYSIGTSGQLAPMNPASLPAGAGSGELFLDSFGQFLYVVNRLSNTVSQYSIGSDGTLTALGTVATGNAPFEIGVTYIGP